MSRAWPDLLLWMGVFLEHNKRRILDKSSIRSHDQSGVLVMNQLPLLVKLSSGSPLSIINHFGHGLRSEVAHQRRCCHHAHRTDTQRISRS
jgi:hypothetical protein